MAQLVSWKRCGTRIRLILSGRSKQKFYIYMDGTADGLTFTLQGQGPNAKGFAGEALGAYGNVRDEHNSYGGYIKNALSLEFDTYLNYDYSDTDYNNQYTQANGDHLAYIHPEMSRCRFNGSLPPSKLKHYNFFSHEFG